MTTPVASRTAAATAGATLSSAPSLIPFEPYGPGPSSFSTHRALHPERQVHARRDAVVDGAEVPDPALVVEQDLLHERVAEGHDRGTLVLPADLAGMEGLADVGHRHVPMDRHVAGLAVDLDLDGRAVELEERGRPAERVIRLGLLAHLADADDLAAERREPADEHVPDGQDALADPDLAAVHGDRRLIDAFESGRHRPQLRLDLAAAVEHRRPHQHRGAARRRLLVVRHDRGVAHDDRDPIERRAEFLGRDLGEDRPRPLAHVGRARVDDHAAVGQQSDGGVRQTGRRTGLQPDRDAAPAPGRRRAPPPDELGRATDGLGPVAVGRRVAGDERVARLGQVPEAKLERVDAERMRGLVHVRFDRPDLLRVAEAAERRGRRRVREDAARQIRTAGVRYGPPDV